MVRSVNWDDSLFWCGRLRPRAAIAKPPSYFERILESKFYSGLDDLDYYSGAMVVLKGGTVAALVQYRGNPQALTTIFLPYDKPDNQFIDDAVAQILELFYLSTSDVMWRENLTIKD